MWKCENVANVETCQPAGVGICGRYATQEREIAGNFDNPVTCTTEP